MRVSAKHRLLEVMILAPSPALKCKNTGLSSFTMHNVLVNVYSLYSFAYFSNKADNQLCYLSLVTKCAGPP